ncbi:MAG: hypothetical protein ACLSVD_07060 [Eggerthellaceae bacterium]
MAAGIGVAWLYLPAPFYAKLDVREAIACIFCAMAGLRAQGAHRSAAARPAAVVPWRCRRLGRWRRAQRR